MPLLDHFHNPGKRRLPWTTMAQAWALSLIGWLNRRLPRDEFRAEMNLHLGRQVEADVAEYDRRANGKHPNGDGSVATMPEAPPALGTVEAVFPDDFEVRVGTSRHELSLCGVIEIVSEANKKELREREAFVRKRAAYLQRGIGVVAIDAVTNRLASLHNQLMQAIGGATPPLLPATAPTYTASYRPVHRDGRNEIDVWPYPAAVGSPLPAAPFALRGGPTLVLDLEATYAGAVRDLGL
jgi:hypothetical protein